MKRGVRSYLGRVWQVMRPWSMELALAGMLIGSAAAGAWIVWHYWGQGDQPLVVAQGQWAGREALHLVR